MPSTRAPEPDIRRYYTDVYDEAGRLDRTPQGRLERARTRELLARLLPPPPATVLDLGGGPGAYASWLAAAGHPVHLVDLVPAHAAAARRDHPVAGAGVGDARHLPYADESVDASLLLGPLYHLTERGDRVIALREAARVTRPGGPVLAAAISRNTPMIDLVRQGRVDDGSRPAILAAYATGVNDPATGFTTAYFHRPEQLVDEFTAAGLPAVTVYGIEGPLWPVLETLGAAEESPLFREAVACARAFECDAAVIGVSCHLLAVATVGAG
ncbi:Methyltransferase domain-containing protein [Micromonospora purpureochromogenes]|uniref:Methyltransferase domain-containing protein n=1 Tax=Micromonospora purpureochromogenes TaxID=47872 RepID=A0A1C4WE75_9ACTN|nr:class I SAM-dependent methyltransferase [Micromonospora purpureochromogenes]SCE94474.1 Methyltransferase domain-containing protein [Micromonospora purpureochromogenes]